MRAKRGLENRSLPSDDRASRRVVLLFITATASCQLALRYSNGDSLAAPAQPSAAFVPEWEAWADERPPAPGTEDVRRCGRTKAPGGTAPLMRRGDTRPRGAPENDDNR